MKFVFCDFIINDFFLAHSYLSVYNLLAYVEQHPDQKFILYISSGDLHIYVDRLAPYLYGVIYDELDNFPLHEIRGHPTTACKKADRIIYSAKSLKELIDKRREVHPDITDKTWFVPNACDFDHWDLPFKSFDNFGPTFKVFYFGAFAYWLDYDLILDVVRKCPHYQFWFIGADFTITAIRHKTEQLANYDNVYIIPHVMYEDLPFFMQQADLLWMPFDLSKRLIQGDKHSFPVDLVTNHVNPIKYYEYLATGRPIVYPQMKAVLQFNYENCDSTKSYNLSAYKTADDVVEVFGNFTDVLNYEPIKENSKNNKELAKACTWEKSVEIVEEVLEDMLITDLIAERVKRGELRNLEAEAKGYTFVDIKQGKREELV